MLMSRGRKRKSTVIRDRTGKSRGEPPDIIRSVAVAYRTREVGRERALDPLAGFTLGKLLLRYRANSSDPGGITDEQYNAGDRWSGVVRRHAAIMGYRLDEPRSLQFMVVGGRAEPSASEIADTRDKWRQCYDALMLVCRDHGLRVRDVTYGVCIEQWPMGRLSGNDIGLLKLGLNAIGRALGLTRRGEWRRLA